MFPTFKKWFFDFPATCFIVGMFGILIGGAFGAVLPVLLFEPPPCDTRYATLTRVVIDGAEFIRQPRHSEDPTP